MSSVFNVTINEQETRVLSLILKASWVIGVVYINNFRVKLDKHWYTKRLEVLNG